MKPRLIVKKFVWFCALAVLSAAGLTSCGKETSATKNWWDKAEIVAYSLDTNGTGIGLTNAHDPDETSCWPDQMIAVTNISKPVNGKSSIGCYRVKGNKVEVVWLFSIECYLKENHEKCRTQELRRDRFTDNTDKTVSLSEFQ